MPLATEALGAMMLLSSAVLYSAAAMFVRLLSDRGISVGLLVCTRASLQVLMAATMLRCNGLLLKPASRTGTRLMLVRGVCGSMAFTLYFVSASLAPLGNATTIASLYPVLTMLGARLLLHESIGAAGLMSILASVGGVCLLSNGVTGTSPGEEEDASGRAVLGYAAAGLSAAAMSGVLIAMRKAAGSFHPLQGVLAHSTLSSLAGLGIYASHQRRSDGLSATWWHKLRIVRAGSVIAVPTIKASF